jgi:hypothetical protein
MMHGQKNIKLCLTLLYFYSVLVMVCRILVQFLDLPTVQYLKIQI